VAVPAADLHPAIDAVWRIESPRLIAGLARMVGDVGLAEELAQDALVAAIEHWPKTGIPDNPGAWLTATAKRRGIDELRRKRLLERKHQELGHEVEAEQALAAPDLDAAIDDHVGDDLLRLVFIACHPILSTEARVALTLRLLGGLTTEEIARAFLVPEPTIAQRIVRAKRTLADGHVPFEVPRGPELVARLSSVHGLVALMEIQASRSAARIGPSGEPILLLEQNRGRWDQMLIRRGLAALERAEQLGGVQGPYALQAAIAACHARATTPEETNWTRIAALYDVLAHVAPSPIVELNRAVALGMAFGPAVGLALVDTLTSEPSLQGYHLLPSVRGDLLAKLGRFGEARAEFARGAALTKNAPERELLTARAEQASRRAP
jgi:RNA polymerase sigma-70 factor (ECF subfamily)